MSIIISAPARTGVESKSKVPARLKLAAVIMLASLVVWGVSSLFDPLTDADRAEMLIDGTSGLPQDR